MLSLLLQILGNLYYFALNVSGAGSFPPPLSSKKEKQLLEKSRAGDIAARNKLIEHNLRLVAHIVKKYYTTANNQDDLISIGTIGLIKAVSTFKSDKNIRLATYASRCIENATLSQMSFWLQKELQKEVAQIVGIARSTYINLETGNHNGFDKTVADKLSKLYNIPVYDLLDDYNRFIAVGQGKLIREHRESLNLGKRPFARALGVDANMIRLWESERKQISLKSWEKYFKDRITL